MKNSQAIYVVDASSFIFRAYYALAPLSSKGRPSHAVAGFASMLLKLIRDKQPLSLVVVFDSKKPSFRKEIFPDYKANREVPPPDLSGQIEAVIKMCHQAGLSCLQEEGIEADDWIATFVRRYESAHPVVIVSADKDLTQLIDEQVSMYDTFREKIWSAKEVEEKWGVQPSQMRDLLALTGDTSDNIPGIEGVGPKTASKWLQDFKDIQGIFKNLSKLSEKMQAKIGSSKEALDLSVKLVSLKDDMKLPFKELPELHIPLKKELRDFLIDWDCHRILDQNSDLLGDGEIRSASLNTKKESSIKKILVESEEDLKRLEAEILKAKLIAFDCETSSFNREEAELVGISFCTHEAEAWYLPYRHGKSEISEKVKFDFLERIFQKKDLRFVAHNSKYDLEIFKKEEIPNGFFCHDTMILSHLLNADRRSHSLDNLAKDFLNEEKGDLKKLLDGEQNFASLDLKVATQYAAQDAALTFQLFELFYPKIKAEKEVFWLYENVELPLVPVLAEMERAGILLDTKVLKKLSEEMHEDLSRIQKEIFKEVGFEFNIGSPKQLQDVLFEKLKLPTGKRTKTGFSTDEKVLSELAIEHKVPRLILEQRKLAKLTSTYVDVLPELVSKKDHRLHTHYHQTGTATGRLSSSEPNLQNIPVRTEAGTKIRKAFVPEKGFELLSADYSQVELRLMAHFSGDKTMIDAFNRGADIHSETATAIFGTADQEHRSRAKAINFGVIYGISSFGLSQQLGISRSDAKDFIDSYFDRFPKVKEFMDSAIEVTRKKLYSETLFGRRRPLPDIKSKNPSLRQMAERMAINAPLQGTAADIMKWAMNQIFRALKSAKLQSRLLLQVHDELIFEVPEKERNELESIIKHGMEDLSKTPIKKLKVPLVAELGHGKSWAEL
ncbi:MAG: DNA polymerase I [Bdellovibrionota bacterium]